MTPFVAMGILHMKEGFSFSELKSAFRFQAIRCHPDTGGDTNEFLEVRLAYDVLVNMCSEKSAEDGGVLRCLDGTPVSDLGKGYPISESAKTCESCRGLGYRKYSSGVRDKTCVYCHGSGIKFYPCKKCLGTGVYKHPSTGKEVGPCYLCGGSGKFYPQNKNFRAFSRRIHCDHCGGYGVVQVAEKGYFISRCDECQGIGELKMWNPVIPRGLFAGKR